MADRSFAVEGSDRGKWDQLFLLPIQGEWTGAQEAQRSPTVRTCGSVCGSRPAGRPARRLARGKPAIMACPARPAWTPVNRTARSPLDRGPSAARGYQAATPQGGCQRLHRPRRRQGGPLDLPVLRRLGHAVITRPDPPGLRLSSSRSWSSWALVPNLPCRRSCRATSRPPWLIAISRAPMRRADVQPREGDRHRVTVLTDRDQQLLIHPRRHHLRHASNGSGGSASSNGRSAAHASPTVPGRPSIRRPRSCSQPASSIWLSSARSATCGTGTKWLRRWRPTSPSTPPF